MKRKIFLIGNNNGIIGTTDDKEYANELLKERGKKYKILKVTNPKTLDSIERAYLPEVVMCFGELLFSDEEEYCLNSFEQYHMDMIRHAEKILDILKYLKFTDKEANVVKELIIELHEYVEAMKHGTLYEDEDGGLYNYFNYNAAVKWYKKHFLNISGDEK